MAEHVGILKVFKLYYDGGFMDINTVLPSVTNEKANGKRKGVKLAKPN